MQSHLTACWDYTNKLHTCCHESATIQSSVSMLHAYTYSYTANRKTWSKHQRSEKWSSEDLRQKKCQHVFGVLSNEVVFKKMRHDRELVQVFYLNMQSQVKNSGTNWVTEMLACLSQQTFLAQLPKRPCSPFLGKSTELLCTTDWGIMCNLLWSDDCCVDIASIHYPGSSNERLRKDAVKMWLGEVHKCLATCWCTSTVFNG